MNNVIRPISRVMAIELEDIEIDGVSGGTAASTNASTDVYTRTPKPEIWKYDGSHAD